LSNSLLDASVAIKVAELKGKFEAEITARTRQSHRLEVTKKASQKDVYEIPAEDVRAGVSCQPVWDRRRVPPFKRVTRGAAPRPLILSE
jgi:hypothetical protein